MESLSGNQYTLNPVNAGLVQYFDFIEFPLNLRYLLYDGKINLIFTGGISSNVLIGNKVIFTYENGEIEPGRTESLRTLSYSGNLGLGLNYELNEQFLFLIEPRFRQYLHSINEKGLIDTRPYMFGLYTGISFKF